MNVHAELNLTFLNIFFSRIFPQKEDQAWEGKHVIFSMICLCGYREVHQMVIKLCRVNAFFVCSVNIDAFFCMFFFLFSFIYIYIFFIMYRRFFYVYISIVELVLAHVF